MLGIDGSRKAEATARIWIDDLTFAKSRGFRGKERSVIPAIVEEHCENLLEAWHEHFD